MVIGYFRAQLPEQHNTRSLFERVLSNMATSEGRDVWQRFQTFESLNGDLSTVCLAAVLLFFDVVDVCFLFPPANL